jgi:hypothetical protein
VNLTRYWQAWVILTFATFIVPEVAALVRGRSQDTLSETTWRWEKLIVHQPISQWSATHLLFAGILLVVGIWTIVHLTLGWWR